MIIEEKLPEFEVDVDIFNTECLGDTDTQTREVELENEHYMVRFDAKITVECVVEEDEPEVGHYYKENQLIDYSGTNFELYNSDGEQIEISDEQENQLKMWYQPG